MKSIIAASVFTLCSGVAFAGDNNGPSNNNGPTTINNVVAPISANTNNNTNINANSNSLKADIRNSNTNVNVNSNAAYSRSLSLSASQARSNSNSRSNSGANANNAITFNQPAVTSTRVSGTQRILSAPAVFAPGLAAAGLETCLGSASGGVSFPGGGFSFGSTTTDHGCDARLDARTLWAMGLRQGAVNRLCAKPEIAAALPQCQPPVTAARPVTASYSSGAPVSYTASVSTISNKSKPCQRYELFRGCLD